MTDQEYASVRDWTDVLRRIRFGPTVKPPGVSRGVRGSTLRAVALMLATYADADGSRVFPGTARVAVACEIDYRTAKRCLAALRWLGLIKVVRSARRRQLADEYQLCIPADLLDRVEVLSPSQMDLAVERIRDGSRRRDDTEPSTGAAGTPTTEPVRVPDAPLQQPEADESTGAGSTPNPGSTGAGSTFLRVRQCPPTHHDLDTTTTHHTEGNLRTAVTVTRAREPLEDQIDDGVSGGIPAAAAAGAAPPNAAYLAAKAALAGRSNVIPLRRRSAS